MSKKSKKKPTRSRAASAPGRPSDLASRLNKPQPFARRDIKTVMILVVVALAVRLTFFFINKSTNPLFYHPILDAAFHQQWADDILHKSFWGDEVFFRAPLYGYFLAALNAMSGSSIAFAVFVQHLLGVGTVVLVFATTRRFFAPPVALVAGVLCALYWPLIYFEGDLLIVTLFTTLTMAFLLVTSLALARGGMVWFIVSGLLFGLSAITRPSVLIFAPALPWVFQLNIKAAGRRWLRPTVAVALGAAVIIAPVLVRNYIVGRDFVPIASQGGVNLYIGNNPESNGTQAIVPGVRGDLMGTYRGAADLAEAEAGHPLKPSQVSNHFAKKALGFIFGSPGAALSLTARKFYYFWGAVERANSKYIQFFWRHYGLGRIPLPGFWLVGPLSLLGGLLLWRRRGELSLLYLFVLTYMVGVIVFFVNARFRLPVTPVLIIFAAFALTYLYYAVRQRDSHLAAAAGVLVLTATFVNYDYMNFRGFRAFDEAVTHYELGNAYIALEDTDGALAEYEKAYDISTRYPTRGYEQIRRFVDFQIGALYWEKELYTRAIEALERVTGDDDQARNAKFMLGDAYLKRGRTDDALRTYSALAQSSPNDARAQIGLATALRGAGQLDRAEQILTSLAGQRTPYAGNVHLELARTLERKQDFAGAEQNYRAAAQSRLVRRDALLELARMYYKTGRRDDAASLFTQLGREYPTDPQLQAEIRGYLQQP